MDSDTDVPSERQQQQLRACYECYRDGAPEGMRVELYGNRVRVEPGAFGRRRMVIDAMAGALAAQVPDDHDIAPGPVASGIDQAREQFRRANLLDIPEGFVRVSTIFEGFEDEGALGVIHLVLKERWEQDRPC